MNKIPGRDAARAWTPRRIGTAGLSFALVALLYSFGRWHGGDWPQPPAAWPWTLLGKNPFDGGLWKTVVYTAAVVLFSGAAYRRWTSPKMGHLAAYHRLRHASILFCQVGLFFVLPYFILKNYDPANWWRIYGIFMPFPLVWEVFFEAPWSWTIAGLVATFVVLPIAVRYTGNAFCSWVCGCGCLAETLGDRWRHLAPKGPAAVRAERWIWVTTIAAFALAPLYIGSRAELIRTGYVTLVDFGYSGVVGVATYFFFGSRIWCRYGCPLRKYIEVLAARFSRVKITAADRCIGCGKCDQQCEMGIPVMEFALAHKTLDNTNSSCIQCGICISVCPTYDLGFGERGDWEKTFARRGFTDARTEASKANGEKNSARVADALADPAVGVHSEWFGAERLGKGA